MTFKEWFRNWFDSVNPYEQLALQAMQDELEHAWNAAMEEAARRMALSVRRLEDLARDGFRANSEALALAGDLRMDLQRFTSGATQAPQEEAPEAGSSAPTAPFPGPRREPG